MIAIWALTAAAILSSTTAGFTAPDPIHTRFFFLHHSTGRYLLDQGNARDYMNSLNVQAETDHVLWDNDYNYIGLSNPSGELEGYSYEIPNDDTDPAGLYTLWTTANSARDSLLSRYDVIAFKSCFPASNITDSAMLAQYKTWYLGIRDVLDQHPGITFVIISPPPLHRLATSAVVADRARAFAVWLGSDEFLVGHPNLVYFDFFDHLAQTDDGTETRNMLRYDYERSHTDLDSHPNVLANEAVAPRFIDFLITLTKSDVSAITPVASNDRLYANVPNPFNPSTTISFSLNRPSSVVLRVFDVRGRLVDTLLSEKMPVGEHQVVWRGRSTAGSEVSSGTYFYLLRTDSDVFTHKMQLLK